MERTTNMDQENSVCRAQDSGRLDPEVNPAAVNFFVYFDTTKTKDEKMRARNDF